MSNQVEHGRSTCHPDWYGGTTPDTQTHTAVTGDSWFATSTERTENLLLYVVNMQVAIAMLKWY